jgi:hypothetical protein
MIPINKPEYPAPRHTIRSGLRVWIGSSLILYEGRMVGNGLNLLVIGPSGTSSRRVAVEPIIW